ncbi:MAG: TonB family protein [Longimicrobiaceae bacterium]
MNTATIGEIRVRCDGGETLLLVPGSELGAGGQATVYPVPGRPDRVAKIYHDPAPEQELKLRQMLLRRPAGAALMGAGAGIFAWPLELLRGEDGALAGLLLPRVEGRLRVFELYNPATRRERAPLFHHGLLHRTARNLAAAFHKLHEAGYVVGDVNESNILVGEDGRVVLIDTDSFQVRDPASGTVYRCPVGRPEFTPPELRERSFAGTDRTPEHDRFGLGVLVFQMLMEGTHPFAGRFRGAGEPPSIQERIAAGHFPHGLRAGGVLEPPRTAPPLQLLAPGVRALVRRCFEDGHHDPAARPSAEEWRDALAAAEEALATCARNEQHRCAPHLGDCPWCERARQLEGRDPFPSAAAVRSGEHGRRAAPVRATRHPGPARAATAAVGPPTTPLSNGWLLGALLVAGWGLGTPSLGPIFTAVVAGMLLIRGWITAGGLAKGGSVAATLAGLTVLFMVAGFAAGTNDPGVPAEPFAYSAMDVDRKPVLLDPEKLAEAVATIPLDLPAMNGTDTVVAVLFFTVDEDGRVAPGSVSFPGVEPPGSARLAELERLLGYVRFEPGMLDGGAVPTRLMVPARSVRGRAVVLLDHELTRGEPLPRLDSLPSATVPQETSAPVDVALAQEKPALLNGSEVQRLLAEMYPPLLRDAGVTGRAHLSFVIDARGRVVPSSVTVVSATHEAFAEASAVVVAGMRFRPARVDGQAVPVLVQIPISWTLDRS